MGEMYGSCGMCGERLPSPSSAGHQCIVGRVRFNPTGAGVTATVPQFTINPLPTFNALPSPQSQIESLQRLLAEKDAQIAAMSKDMVKIAGMVDSANERIEAMTAQLAECYRLSGADTDGDEEWRYAPNAVAEVRRLRTESDEDEERLIDIRSQLSALQRAARDYMAARDGHEFSSREAVQDAKMRTRQALMDLLK